MFDIRIRKRVEPQRRHLGVWRHGGQVLFDHCPQANRPRGTIYGSRLSARSSRRVRIASKGVRASDKPARHLVKSVDEERFATPFGMATHIENVMKSRAVDQDGFLAKLPTLDFEGGGLAGAGVAEQHVRRLGAEFPQGPGVPLPMLIRLILCNLAAGARDRVGHSASNHSLAGTLRNSLSGTPRSPTSTERRGANRLLNSAMPLTPADLEPLFASMATNLGPRFSTKSTSIEFSRQ